MSASPTSGEAPHRTQGHGEAKTSPGASLTRPLRPLVLGSLLWVMGPSLVVDARPGTVEPTTENPDPSAKVDSEPGDSDGPGTRDSIPIGFAGPQRPDTEVSATMRAATPTQFKPVGSTSVVFRMLLQGDVDAAFKPYSHSHGRGDLHEVAAYRISRALGLHSVPPAVLRWIPLETIRKHLHPEYVDRWDSLSSDMVWNENGTVRGAAIFWIPDMRELGLDKEEGRERWMGWLNQATPLPTGAREQVLARQVSTMIAFDYLIANWDRFSGANAQGNKAGDRLYVRDHNLAFQTRLNNKRHRRITRALEQVQRFSRGFVRALKDMDEASLRDALTRLDPAVQEASDQDEKPTGARLPLLTNAQIGELLDRRAGLLSWIAALADRHGADAVLCMP